MKIRSFLYTVAVVTSLLPFVAYLFQTASANKIPPYAEELHTSPVKTIAVKSSNIEFPPATNRHSPIGINANEIYEQDSSIPFVNLIHSATPFHENIRCRVQDQPCLTSAKVTYDNQGWPKNLHGGKAGLFFLRNVQLAALPTGDFTVLYDGEGKIDYLHNIEVISRKLNKDTGEDTIRFNARADGFLTAALQIIESNPDKPLKNIRILLPGGICHDDPFHQVSDASVCEKNDKNKVNFLSFKKHHKDIIFNPDYLNFMKDFSVIRFMPMSGITRNPAKRWDQRPNMNKATWGGIYGSRGAPLEIQIALANKLKADPWLNVPHGADDDYVYRFAIYVHDNLDPELKPHIEYTNEAWNANFVHNEHMQKMGIAEKLDQDALMAGYKYYAKRSVEFFDIWETVYGDNEKIIRIIGGWDTRPDISGIILAYNDTYKSVDAIAIAPYIGGNLRGFRESEDVDDIFKLLSDEKSYRSLPKIMEELKKHAQLAKEFGVSLIAYEGGQSLVDWAAKDYLQHPNPLFFAANRDDRMGDIYQNLYSEWRDMGADLFVAFSAPRAFNAHGCWGLKEHIRQDIDNAPKLKASLKFAQENPSWWDWEKIKDQKKPNSSDVEHYLPVLNPDKPRIVIRPAKGEKKNFHRLENPNALNILLEGESWNKRDISGKWQVKWDEENIYLIAKVYDTEAIFDSDDPSHDDSVEFFIDGNNDKGSNFDKNNDFHFIFKRVSLNRSNKFDGTERIKTDLQGISGKENPKYLTVDLPYQIQSKFDGYEIKATINWKQLGLTPEVKKNLRMDVIINDDDDGGDRDARLSWNTRESQPSPKDFGMILMSGR